MIAQGRLGHKAMEVEEWKQCYDGRSPQRSHLDHTEPVGSAVAWRGGVEGCRRRVAWDAASEDAFGSYRCLEDGGRRSMRVQSLFISAATIQGEASTRRLRVPRAPTVTMVLQNKR